jgi:hypothetical protein
MSKRDVEKFVNAESAAIISGDLKMDKIHLIDMTLVRTSVTEGYPTDSCQGCCTDASTVLCKTIRKITDCGDDVWNVSDEQD